MADLQIINKMAKIEKIKDDIISLDQIISEIPYIDYETPMLYELYLFYNKKSLTEPEIEKLNKIIEVMKYNQSQEMNKNLDYLNRDINLLSDVI